MVDTYAFHTFPRRNHDLGNALRVLQSIIECGLLLTPEVTEWSEPLSDGGRSEPFFLQQKRCCFTALRTDELPGHMDRFGPFSIRYDLMAFRRLGGMPVAYVPRSDQRYGGHAAVGETLLARLADIEGVLQRLADLEKKGQGIFSTPAGRSMTDLVNALRVFEGFIYMANRTDDDLTEYFRQREWRIVANIVASDGNPLALGLPEECRRRLLQIDQEFFGGELEFRSGRHVRIDMTTAIHTVEAQHVLNFADALIVPEEAIEGRTTLEASGLSLPVLGVEA